MAGRPRQKGDKIAGAGDWKDGFLAFYRRYPNIMRAARHIKVTRAMVYKEAAQNPEFKAQMEEAKQEGIETIEGVAMELAASNRDPKHNGLRMFMLKAHKPEIYGDRGELTLRGAKEAPVRLEVVNRMQTLTEEEFELLVRLRDKLDGPTMDADAGRNLLGAGSSSETEG